MEITTYYCCPKHENEILFTEVYNPAVVEMIIMKHDLPKECPKCMAENQKTYSYFKTECIAKRK